MPGAAGCDHDCAAIFCDDRWRHRVMGPFPGDYVWRSETGPFASSRPGEESLKARIVLLRIEALLWTDDAGATSAGRVRRVGIGDGHSVLVDE